MNQNQYKYLIWSGTTVLVFLSLFLLVKTNQEFNSTKTTNTISFSGTGKILAKPDVAVLSFSIVTEAINSKNAQNDNSKKSKEVVDFLKKQDIKDNDIKTTGYNIYPQYVYPQNGRPQIRGYQVSQDLEIKVRDLDKLNNIVDGVVMAGVNRFNSLVFKVDNLEDLKLQARKRAIKDAQNKAKELEKQIDIKLGKIVDFSENDDRFNPFMSKTIADGTGESSFSEALPSLPSGENEIIVNVTLTYQIK
jgi:uncharacterized protein YggE